MWKTVVRRVLIMIPQMIVLSLVMFILANMMPGDAVTGMLDPTVPYAEMQRQREMLGLNDPWYIRYVRWITAIIFEGDFGQSIVHFRPVTQIIGERMGRTFWLSGFTMILIYLVSIPLGIAVGRHAGSVFDRGVTIYIFLAMGVPTIVLALVILFVFGFRLEWIPIRGSVDVTIVDDTFRYILSRIHHMIGPAVTSTLLGLTGITLTLRMGIVDGAVSDYVMLARSKGVPQNKLYSRHVFRNALIPITQSIGMLLVGLISGSIFIEMMFNFPGMGRLFLDSIVRRDFTVSNALIMLFGFLSVVGILLSDIIITIVDPRIRIK
jgi:peptide/nickel transport system permease protein